MKLTAEEKAKILHLLSFVGISEELIDTKVDEELVTVTINLEEDEAGIFIGRAGSTLDSLQLLLSLMLNHNEIVHRPVLLDIAGYRSRRLATLKEMVDRVSQEVLNLGVSRALPPLTATERRQVHLLLQNHASLTTHSEGDRHNRRLFISPKNNS